MRKSVKCISVEPQPPEYAAVSMPPLVAAEQLFKHIHFVASAGFPLVILPAVSPGVVLMEQYLLRAGSAGDIKIKLPVDLISGCNSGP